MSLSSCLIVMAGGAVGSLLRYLVTVLTAPTGAQLPWGTILVNVTGSFAIGLFAALTVAQGRYPLPEAARLFVMVGLLGGYTTFSAFSLQTLDLLRDGAPLRAMLNVVLSVLLCLAAVAAGHLLATRMAGSSAASAQNTPEREG